MITAERLDRDALMAAQGRRLSELVTTIYRRNTFYTRKFDDAIALLTRKPKSLGDPLRLLLEVRA